MKASLHNLSLVALVLAAFQATGAHAQSLSIAHPGDSSKHVEYFLEKPGGKGPWPTVVFLHGHQDGLRPGGRDFVTWGILDRFAKRGYLAVAVSQPGYGASSGPADFCGPYTQHAVSAVIAKFRRDGDSVLDKVVIEGISRGALVAGLIAAEDPSIAGIVLISGLYDLPRFMADPKSGEARLVAQSIIEETGGGSDALQKRSVLHFARNIKTAAIIMNGGKDDRTDPEQARRLATEINFNGGTSRAIIYPEYGHQIPVKAPESAIGQFIDAVLGK